MCSRPRKPQRKPKPERNRNLGLVRKRRVVEPQLLDRVAQLLVVGAVDRIEPGENHRLHLLEAGQRRIARPIGVGHGVADAGLGDVLDAGGEEAHLAGAELVDLDGPRREHADARHLVVTVGLHHVDAIALANAPSMRRTSTIAPR